MASDHWFDDLARGMATAMPRRKVLRAFAAGVTGLVLGSAGTPEAMAARKEKEKRCRSSADCGQCGLCIAPLRGNGWGFCAAEPSFCTSLGDCTVCDEASFTCVPAPEFTRCGGCGTCVGGLCEARDALCTGCQRCDEASMTCTGGCGADQVCCAAPGGAGSSCHPSTCPSGQRFDPSACTCAPCPHPADTGEHGCTPEFDALCHQNYGGDYHCLSYEPDRQRVLCGPVTC